jgi:hypothetical protein
MSLKLSGVGRRALGVGMAACLWIAAVVWIAKPIGPVVVVAAAPRDGAPAALVQNPQFIAPANSTTSKCHTKEKDWSEKLDGDGKGKQHLNADGQLSAKQYPAVTKYLAALGQKDPYDIKGACVRCHTTVIQGSADAGITCQSCHGPGSLYNKPHQEEGAYDKGVPLPGLLRYINEPKQWAPICIDCHVLGNGGATDAKLVAAGHTSGVGQTDFTLSKKFDRVAPHWKNAKKHTVQTIAQFDGRRDQIAAKIAAAPPPVAAAPAPAPVAPPAAPPPAAAPAPAQPTPSVMNPAAAPVNPPAPAGRAANPPTVPPTVKPTPAAPPPAPPMRSAAPALPSPAPAPAPNRASAPAAPPPVTPAAPPPVAAPPPAAALPPAPDPPPLAPLPAIGPALAQTPVALVGALQGRLIALLDALLRQNVSRPIAPPAPQTTYTGPNADLLRLQQEVIALALQALAAEPRKASAPDSAK